MKNSNLNQYTALMAGADAGHYLLPDEVVEARRVLDRAEQAATAYTTPDAERRRTDFARAILASTGDTWPDPSSLVDIEDDQRAYTAWTDAVREAQHVAGQGLYEALSADPDRLIVDYLRPAHTAAVDVARTHAVFAPLADDATILSALTPSQRAKANDLAGAAACYAAVRGAWTGLTRIGQHERRDHDGVFAELRDLPTVWPSYRQRGHDQPWPTTPVARFCWIATHARPWLPTVDEQETRWLEVYGQAERDTLGNRRNATALSGVFG